MGRGGVNNKATKKQRCFPHGQLPDGHRWHGRLWEVLNHDSLKRCIGLTAEGLTIPRNQNW
jgi:hypothetical protein